MQTAHRWQFQFSLQPLTALDREPFGEQIVNWSNSGACKQPRHRWQFLLHIVIVSKQQHNRYLVIGNCQRTAQLEQLGCMQTSHNRWQFFLQPQLLHWVGEPLGEQIGPVNPRSTILLHPSPVIKAGISKQHFRRWQILFLFTPTTAFKLGRRTTW